MKPSSASFGRAALPWSPVCRRRFTCQRDSVRPPGLAVRCRAVSVAAGHGRMGSQRWWRTWTCTGRPFSRVFFILGKNFCPN
jgi:hypothetical protein